MCGIVGTLVFDGGSFRVTEPYLVKMRDRMVHRGPDGAGLWIEAGGRIGLGHRRLSIIDLASSAAQPMPNEDERLWIAFNGEIYNHAAIRRELETLGGHRWRTDHSDTEVILHAFETWGIGCLDKFRGMFAIALWDGRRRELWLIRDRIGVKPLYYSLHHGRLTFASEIKALLEDPDQPKALHEESLFHYLSFLTAPAPQTLFHGIKKIPGGTWLRVQADGTIEERRYWDVWDHTAPLVGRSDGDIAACVLEKLRESVALRKVSDVPVGVFLSGGVDSSTNAALFSQGEARPVRTFTIGYDREYASYRNELAYARLVANHVGAEHHERLLSVDDLINFLPQMVVLQDEPIADPVCIPVYYVSQLARERGVIVCQVGEGADELFWGYPAWKTALQLEAWNRWPVPFFAKRCGLHLLRWIGQGESFHYERLRRGLLNQPVFWGGAEAFPEALKQRLLSPSLRKRFRDLTSWEAIRPIRQRFEAKAWEQSPLQWMSYLDLNFRLPELLLMRVDKMSMGAGLEARVPFLDHEFVQMAMSIPEAVKTRGGVMKTLLKQAVRGVIPDRIIDRPKQGFGVPVHEWMQGRLGSLMQETLTDFCRRTDLLDGAEAMRVLRDQRDPRGWYLFNLALWWRTYLA
ncbi:asparagine synthase (glutamine-hydrolyzing) [Nitrospirales bacterium NOB]|nr:Asparagine synthetase [glutamine-hydrolyzing] 1 [Nitrospirota bacterium]MCE7964276.1 asparagine synthase (glutamine-hydrolyzing) [Nitrospira sp. NTP2]MCK6492647.1 asparagine synthase (glutamine-hydrolyzing) [Nitrospira sp.]MDL1890526.1 asparagine synthase (glutamine-hydrolyzing) [Nitrospirales bacterium NOB]MEB2337282.1 asparagine synthase (glutamine-hydrolyzing) [Nitrospirales bacterium]